jgi:arsenical pump membrane protein
LLDPGGARAAAVQDWPPFVLVAGLLLIGLVADDDGLFAVAGNRLARLASGELATFCGAVVLVAAVTAALNLDTSVAFLTPVLVHLARRRRSEEAPLLYGCLLLSNAASLLLPGSNLTNLIVLGHLHLSGGHFAARMAPAFGASVVTTALVVILVHRRHFSTHRPRALEPDVHIRSLTTAPNTLRAPDDDAPEPSKSLNGTLGAASVVAATLAVLLLRSPALAVAAVGAAATAVRLLQRRERLAHVVEILDAQVLIGLLGVAVALGTLARSWTAPASLLAHLGSWATAAVAAVASVLLNNLPAASLLAARVPPHPFSLLVGLNLGPNLFVTGSLSSFLWLKSARRAGATPSVGRVTRLGVLVVPISMAGALGALAATGAH